jgi:hypothetical protein
MKPAKPVLAIVVFTALVSSAAETYRKPSKAVLDILNAPTTPTLSISPTRTFAMQGAPVRNPPIAELSQPMLRLGGIRINPRTNGLHNTTFNTTLTLRKIPEGTEVKVDLPPDPKLSLGRWSPDARHFAFTNTTGTGIDLWVGDTGTGKTHKIPGVKINSVMGGGRGGRGGGGAGDLQWLPDGQSLLVQMVPPNRGAAPPAPAVPPGPNVEESLGGGRGARTFEDLLETPHDEDLLEYYATAQLASIELAGNKVTPVGKPAILESVRVSPDGKYFLVTTIHRPFSFTYPARQFPKEIEVWDRAGKVVHKVASLPLASGGRGGPDAGGGSTPAGTRSLQWRVGEPATLMWLEAVGPAPPPAEAQGQGRGNGASQRPDRIMSLKAPFTGSPQELFKATHSIQGIQWRRRWADPDRERRPRRADVADLRHQSESRRPARAAAAHAQSERSLQRSRHPDDQGAGQRRPRPADRGRQSLLHRRRRIAAGRPSVPRPVQSHDPEIRAPVPER